MNKLLILGHKGMLGNACHTYFSSRKDEFEVLIMEERFPDISFKEKIKEINPDFIINCIGKIPQKDDLKNTGQEFYKTNIELPEFLETLDIKIIHPSTDCEFSGDLPREKLYNKNSKRDAMDPYGKSKAFISEKIENEFKNTKIIRVSIIGHEINTTLSLLDWALSQENSTRGYIDHYWNGITTLEWSIICHKIIKNWDETPTLSQYGTEEINSKYDLLKIIFEVYNKNIKVEEYSTGKDVNKCLESDARLKNIKQQLEDLKIFYNK